MNWLLLGAVLALGAMPGDAAFRRWRDLLCSDVEDQAIGALLLVEYHADHGTRTGPKKPKYVSGLPPV